MTTLEPGASDVLTQGFRSRPRSTAFLARRPAASMTEGLEVFVQLVIAAITTDPWSSTSAASSSMTARLDGDSGEPSPQTPTAAGPSLEPLAASLPGRLVPAGNRLGKASWNERRASESRIRSWGRRGPAMLGSTVQRSRARVSVNTGSGDLADWKTPC